MGAILPQPVRVLDVSRGGIPPGPRLPTVEILCAGYGLVESPRWHGGRLWFSDWTGGRIVAVDDAGASEVVVEHRSLPMCFDFLPDGRLVLVSNQHRELLTLEGDGLLAHYADLSSVSAYGCNDIVVDGRGNAYVNSPDFDFATGPPEGDARPRGPGGGRRPRVPERDGRDRRRRHAGGGRLLPPPPCRLRRRRRRVARRSTRLGRPRRPQPRRRLPRCRRRRVVRRRTPPGLRPGGRGRGGARHRRSRPGRVRVHARGRGLPRALRGNGGVAGCGRPDDPYRLGRAGAEGARRR